MLEVKAFYLILLLKVFEQLFQLVDILEKIPTASTWIKPKLEDQRYKIREPKRERIVPEVQERNSRLQDPAMFKRSLKSMQTSINRNMDIGRSKTSMLTLKEINSNTQSPYIFK